MNLLDDLANSKTYQVYKDYLSIKLHFKSPKFDYFSMGVRTKVDTLKSRKDLIFFNKLSKKRNSRDIILANFLENPNQWIGDLSTAEANDVYLNWKRKIDSLTYIFKSELSLLEPENFFENFEVKGSNLPRVLDLHISKEISLETFSILIKVTKISNYWKKNITDQYVVPDIILRAEKYYPFLNVDEKKFEKIVMDYAY